MSRLQALAARPRLALGTLLTLALASATVAGSGADFTASSATAATTFSSGTLTMTNSAAGTALLTASNLRPGGPAATGDVDIANTGSLSATFSLTRGTVTDGTPALAPKLDVTVTDCGLWSGGSAPPCAGGTTVYSGTLAAMATSPLGTYAGGDKHRYHVSVTLNASADDTYQGKSASTTFTFSAV
jgi:hypothetical protein